MIIYESYPPRVIFHFELAGHLVRTTDDLAGLKKSIVSIHGQNGSLPLKPSRNTFLKILQFSLEPPANSIVSVETDQ